MFTNITTGTPTPAPTVTDVILSMSPLVRLVFGLTLTGALLCGTWSTYIANRAILTDVPRAGGTYVEAIVGTPRFINPLLANSQSDRDLTAVVYAGLMTRNAKGDLVPEIATGYSISDDGRTYTFTLKQDVTFHDGIPLTADDVVFTVTQAANANIRSPLYANWEGIVAEATDRYTVTFTLPEPYALFIENTTLGILPQHIWGSLTDEEFSYSQFNAEPIGAGPYQHRAVVVDKSGIPERYELVAFDQYVLGAPPITNLHFMIASDRAQAMEAYHVGTADALYGLLPTTAEVTQEAATPNPLILRAPQLRTFAVFLNHNRQPLFMRDPVREALDLAVPRETIISEVLKGYGQPLTAPIPAWALPTASSTTPESTMTDNDRITQAQTILEDAGWTRGEDGIYSYESKDEVLRLAFSLSTTDIPELAETAQRIAASWRSVGAEVEVKVFGAGDLSQSVIRPRRYDALLFGVDVGHELDLYAFWHSSQRNDPGLNIAQYADIEADAALEKARASTDPSLRAEYLAAFSEQIATEHAAIFIYTPEVTYLNRERIHNVRLHPIATPSERFDTIHEWYIETDHVWPIIRDLVD